MFKPDVIFNFEKYIIRSAGAKFFANFINYLSNNIYMIVSEKVKLFFKPSKVKIILTIVILIYAFYAAFMVSLWGHSPSPIPVLLFMPLIMFIGIFSLRKNSRGHFVPLEPFGLFKPDVIFNFCLLLFSYD